MGKINVKSGIFGLVLLVAVFAANNVFAQQMQRFYNNQNGNRMMLHQNTDQRGMRMAGLNLSEEQQTKLVELRNKNMKEMLPIRNELQEKRAHLRTLTTAENINQKEIDKVVDEITALTSKQLKTRIAHQQEVRSILTDDQRVLFDSMNHRGLGKGSLSMGKGRTGNRRMMQPGPGFRTR